MTPRAPLERVEALKKVLCCVNEREQWFSFEEFKDIFAILDEHGTIQPLVDMADDLTERNMKLEAQLEKQRPLIEAVMGAEPYLTWLEETASGCGEAYRAVFKLRAALKLRSEK